MKEIGGSFSLQLCGYPRGNSNFKGFQLVNTGRAALKCIADSLDSGVVLLPEYLCESMLKCWDNHEVIFYPLKEKLLIDYDRLEDIINKNKVVAILVINYFGRLDPCIPDRIYTLCESQKIKIIEDATHSCLTGTPFYADYVFASIRKTLPVPDGAILRSRTPVKVTSHNKLIYYYFCLVRLIAMILKNIQFLKKIWYPMILYAESLLDKYNIIAFPYITYFLLNILNLKAIVQQRKNNYKTLYNLLSHWAFFPDEQCLTFGFPVIFNNKERRNYIRKNLISHNIYPPIHWEVPEKIISLYSNSIAERIMTIPIDQRYNTKDMEKVATLVKLYNKKFSL